MTNTHSPDPPDAHADTETTLVIGGTGKTGRRVTARLRERNVPVRNGTRSAHTPFDWHDESTWEPSLRGVTSAYLTYHPDVGFPDAAEKVRAFADLALSHGVRRLVLLSGRGSDGALSAERALRDSGADWTIVRSSWFAQNFDEGFLTDLVRGDVIAFPAGEVSEPFVDADDVADVVLAALTDNRHVGHVYEVTGPRSLTFGEVAAEISRATGQPVRYAPTSFDEFAETLVGAGASREFVTRTVAVFRAILDGRNANPADGVARALGRQPTDFADYANAVAPTGVWNPRTPS